MDPQSQIQNPEQVSEPPAPVPSTAQVLPAQPPKSNTLLILIGLILIILSGVGGFYLGSYVFPQEPSPTPTPASSPIPSPTPTSDPTADWKTYTSEVLGFTVRYPDTWHLTKCGPGEAALLNPNTSPVCAGEPYEPIQFFSSTEKQTEEEFLASIGPEFKLTSKAGIMEAGVTHQKYLVEKVQPAPGPDSYIQIRVPLDNGTFKIYIFDLQYETIADQILSTFKFTE